MALRSDSRSDVVRGGVARPNGPVISNSQPATGNRQSSILNPRSSVVRRQSVIGTIAVGGAPFGAAVNPATNRLFVIDDVSGVVSVIDTSNNVVITTVPLPAGTSPEGVAVNPVTDRVYVANGTPANTVSVIDGSNNSVSTTISSGTFSRPRAVAVNSATNTIYVTNKDSNAVSVINGVSNSVTTAVTVGTGPFAVAVNPATNRIYVANNGSNNVSVIDGGSNTVIGSPIPVGSTPEGIAVNPITNRIFVTNALGNSVSMIDGSNNTVVSTTSINSVGNDPNAIVVNSVTNRVFAAMDNSNNVAVFDGTTNALFTTLPVGNNPFGVMAINESTGRVYVPNKNDGTVSILLDPPPPCVAAPPGIVAWWTADGNANDLVGSNNGTLLNGATFAAQGRVGPAFSVNNNGTNQSQRMSVPDNPSLNFSPTSPMTVELWAYRTGTDGLGHLLGKRNGCSNGNYQLAFDSNGLAFGAPFSDVRTGRSIDIDLPRNTWTHVAATFNGSTLTLYVNGSVVATTTGALGSPVSDPLIIGDSGTCNQPFEGLLDEVSMYNRALSATEIQAIVQSGAAGKCLPAAQPPRPICAPVPAGIVSWLRAEGNANDTVGNNNGTLQNGATFAAGEVGQAFSFDGTSSVTLSSLPAVSNVGSWTYDLWINASNFNNGSYFIDRTSETQNLASLTATNGQFFFQIRYDSGSGLGGPVGGAINVGAWTHIAMVREYGVAFRLYVSGLLVASTSDNGSSLTPPIPKLGHHDLAGAAGFVGLIDEFDIFNRALSQSEIQSIFNAGSAGKCLTAGSPFVPTSSFNAVLDFTIAGNPNGAWSYGVTTTTGSTFALDSNKNFDSQKDYWSATGNGPFITHNKTLQTITYATITQPPDLLNLDPSFDGRNPVVRWTAPTGGTFQVNGRFQGIDTGPTTTIANVLKNSSTNLFSANINSFGGQAPFSLTVTVVAGDTIDFSVNNGGNGSFNDSTGLAATIALGSAPPANVVTNTNDSGAGSLRNAIAFADANPGSTISFKIPTSDPGFANGVFTIKPTSPLPTVTANGTVIDGNTQIAFTGVTNSAGPPIVLDGSLLAPNTFSGIEINADNCIVRSLIVNNGFGTAILIFGTGGHLVAAGNRVEGCYVGTNAAGASVPSRHNGEGIVVGDDGFTPGSGAVNNTIGGTTVASRNLASGSDGYGIQISGAASTGNLVAGNYIGTNAAGTTALGNLTAGVLVHRGAHNNTIGGATTNARNLISGNVGNVGGIFMVGVGTNNNLVQGNYLGTDATGNAALPNAFGGGVVIADGAQANTVGGSTSTPGAAPGNLIAGNDGPGVSIGLSSGSTAPQGNCVKGNLIGTNATGNAALGNAFGVRIDGGAQGNTIGGTTSGAGNVIAFNTQDGVNVSSGTGNRISQNSIHDNTQLGINLQGGTEDTFGVTANHTGAASGPNNLQNYPVGTSAQIAGGTITISGSLNSTPNSNFTLEFFGNVAADPSGFGEGATYLGSLNVTTDANGNTTGNVSFGVATAPNFVTATATDANGNTSEFSQAVAVTAGAVTLKADYQFQNVLTSSVGTPPALTNLNLNGNNTFASDLVGGVAQTVLQFPIGNGVQLAPTTGVIPNSSYTMVVDFRFDAVSGFRRIVDFKNATSDTGFYVLNSNLNFFNITTGSGSPIAINSYVRVALTRDGAKNVVGYVNGVQQFTFVDAGDVALIDTNNTLRFFRDDNVTPNEHSGGAVARIQLYDGALSSSQVAALGGVQAGTGTPFDVTYPTGLSLIAVPCAQNPASLFGNSFQFAGWDNGTQSYQIGNQPVVRGGAYWLKLTAAQQVLLTQCDDRTPASFVLKRGWNLLGNPFNADLPWVLANIGVTFNNQTQTLADIANSPTSLRQLVATFAWLYDGATYRIVTDPSQVGSVPASFGSALSVLPKGKGAWIFSNEDSVTLTINAPASLSRTLRSATVRRLTATTNLSSQWTSALEVTAGSAHDGALFIGYDAGQTVPVRLQKPPIAPGDTFVDATFASSTPVRYATDIRKSIADGDAWEFTVTTNAKDEDVQVRWPSLGTLPRAYRLILVDLTTGKRQAMRTTSAYAFHSTPPLRPSPNRGGDGGGVTQRRFRIEVSTSNDNRLAVSSVNLSRAAAGYHVAYALTKDAEVVGRLLNPAGKIITTTPLTRARAGLNSATFDAKDSLGRVPARGVYLFELVAQTDEGEQVKALKSVVVK